MRAFKAETLRSLTVLSLLGWSVTYVQDVRGGGPNSGYISSGFFGGERHAIEQSYIQY